MIHVPGRHLVCTDTLSRAPLAVKSPSPVEARSLGEYISMVMEEPLALRRFSKLLRLTL